MIDQEEVRAAAERLQTLWNGGTMDSAYGTNLSLEGQRVYCSFDMEKCARAYLDALPTLARLRENLPERKERT